MQTRFLTLTQTLKSTTRSFSSSKPSTSSSQLSPTLAGLRAILAAESPTLTEFVEGEGPYFVEVSTKKKQLPKPKWMKESILDSEKYTQIKKLRELKLYTVCEEAKCPNLGECWSGGETGIAAATIMILGDTCKHGCRFCNVKTSRTPLQPDTKEPANVAEAIVSWGLDYVHGYY